MSFTVTKVDIWTSKIEDKPGGLAKVLGALGNAGGSLDCVVAGFDDCHRCRSGPRALPERRPSA